MCVHVCACVLACVCVLAFVHVCVCVCVYGGGGVYSNDSVIESLGTFTLIKTYLSTSQVSSSLRLECHTVVVGQCRRQILCGQNEEPIDIMVHVLKGRAELLEFPVDTFSTLLTEEAKGDAESPHAGNCVTLKHV